jgi:gamma-glutamylcyclotransferase (GGCT)/AIG2-like uncharacterized protein YtfP
VTKSAVVRGESEGRVPSALAHPYFAYGSNLNRADMRERCPSARALAVARLDGWRLTFRGVANIEPAEGRTVHGALWWLSRDDLVALDRYEGAPIHYRQRIVVVDTDHGPRRAIAYLMERPSYLGLPSTWYLGRIAEGFRDWGLPARELRRALAETRAELERLGVSRYDPDGPKRMRAVLGAVRAEAEKPSETEKPAEAKAPVRPAPGEELRVWLDDDLENRAAPEGWIHVTTAREAVGLLDTERVVELSLDHDLGDDERYGRGTDVVDFLAEQQEIHSRLLWPRDGITVHSANPSGRDAIRRTIRRYASRHFTVHESLSPSGKPVFRFEPCG